MDYSIFKPGDKVRGKHEYSFIKGTVLFSHEMCLVIQRVAGTVPEYYSAVSFEKIPERTSKFRNVFFLYAVLCFSHAEYGSVFQARENRKAAEKYVGVFEEVFEDGKLVETKYHSDA